MPLCARAAAGRLLFCTARQLQRARAAPSLRLEQVGCQLRQGGRAAAGRRHGRAPEMPRATWEPMRVSRQVLSASWSTTACTLRHFARKGTRMSTFISAVYSSISNTVRFSTSASARARA